MLIIIMIIVIIINNTINNIINDINDTVIFTIITIKANTYICSPLHDQMINSVNRKKHVQHALQKVHRDRLISWEQEREPGLEPLTLNLIDLADRKDN